MVVVLNEEFKLVNLLLIEFLSARNHATFVSTELVLVRRNLKWRVRFWVEVFLRVRGDTFCVVTEVKSVVEEGNDGLLGFERASHDV